MGRIGKIRGRCDEMVVCGMGNIGPWVFEEVLRGAAGIGDDWQVVVCRERERDLVVLHVETDGTSRLSDLEHLVLANLRSRFADFFANLEMRLFDLRVAPHPPGSLRRGGRKLRRVVDERRMVDEQNARSTAAV
jgi:phenylacetate-coenzyme A ligase PaaK-like adenylate-forming protein